ncbi:MAG: alpha-1,2-fucosyltransferase [Lachnospiraceae bacterium]|nr:alpha-1,2-fucosyltransferase [Lachnospiraceae bacterium]
MKIQFINGGLANQVFQYIFVRHAELANPGQEKWYFDDSFFDVVDIHNGYELERVFGIKANLLSKYFEPDVWEEFIRLKKEGKSVPQTLKDFGMDIAMYAETSNYKHFNPFDGQIVTFYGANEFHPDLTRLQYPNIYYHGYWINKNWLATYREPILKELTFPAITLPSAIEYANRIMCESVAAVHIRRGDYVDLGWDIGCEYYQKTIRELTEQYQGFVLFVFSDDLNWCREHAKELGLDLAKDVVYVEGNTGQNSYIDMQLMSMCQGMIISNSAFSYLAALMNNRLTFYANPTSREI